MINYVLWGIAGLMAIALIWLWIFRPKGEKYIIEVYKKTNNGSIIRINADKRYYGYNIRENSVNKFKLPNSLGGGTTQGITERENINTNSKLPLVSLLKKGEKLYTPLIINFDTEGVKNIEEIDNEFIYWVVTEERDLEKRHSVEDKWAKWRAPLIIGVIGIMCLLLIAGTSQQVTKMQKEAFEEVIGIAEKQASLSERILNFVKDPTGANAETESQETTAQRPTESG